MSDTLMQRPELTTTLGTDVGGVFALPLPVARQVSLCSEGFAALGAFVRLHCSVEPLVFQKLKSILEAASTQGTVVCDPSA